MSASAKTVTLAIPKWHVFWHENCYTLLLSAYLFALTGASFQDN